jgi:hypothetical protein
MTAMENDEPFLSREQAATMLTQHGYKMAKATLAKMASFGKGPVFRKWGKATLYRPSDLLTWAKQETVAVQPQRLPPTHVMNVSRTESWYEIRGIRYTICQGSDQEFVVPRAFEVKEVSAFSDGMVHLVLKWV